MWDSKVLIVPLGPMQALLALMLTPDTLDIVLAAAMADRMVLITFLLALTTGQAARFCSFAVPA